MYRSFGPFSGVCFGFAMFLGFPQFSADQVFCVWLGQKALNTQITKDVFPFFQEILKYNLINTFPIFFHTVQIYSKVCVTLVRYKDGRNNRGRRHQEKRGNRSLR